MSAEISDNFAQVAAQYQASLDDVKPALSDRAEIMRPCHYPHFCAKFALSASRSDGMNLAVGFNPCHYYRDSRSLLFALEGRRILAGGASHRVQAANSSRPGRGAGRE